MSLTVEPNDDAIAEGETKATQRHQQQEGVWNLVWRKRLGYFLTVVATADLLLYPLYRESYGFEELRTRLRLLSDTIRLIGNALPGLASRWLDAYARDPAQFVISAGLVFFLLWISARLAGRINDRMRHLFVEAYHCPGPILARPTSVFQHGDVASQGGFEPRGPTAIVKYMPSELVRTDTGRDDRAQVHEAVIRKARREVIDLLHRAVEGNDDFHRRCVDLRRQGFEAAGECRAALDDGNHDSEIRRGQ